MLFIAEICNGQSFIGNTSKQIKKKWQRLTDSVQVIIEEQPDRISVKFRDKRYKSIDKNYYLKEKVCVAEEVIAYCDSCYQIYLEDILHQQNTYWLKISDKLWLSDYKTGLQLELYPEKNYAYIVRRIRLSPSEYRALSAGAIQ